MRYVAAILSTLLVVGCRSTPASRSHTQSRDVPTDAPLEFLLTSAAADFHAHHPPYPTRFRDVRLGYVEASDGVPGNTCCAVPSLACRGSHGRLDSIRDHQDL